MRQNLKNFYGRFVHRASCIVHRIHNFTKHEARSTKHTNAFSLLELAIVLVIISILIVGVTQGAAMINAARLTNARSVTSKSPVPNIPGLTAWYETSLRDSFKGSEAIENGQITEWYDISPNSLASKKNKLTKTAGSDAIYRISGINKTPSVKFSGSGKISLANFYQGNTDRKSVV